MGYGLIEETTKWQRRGSNEPWLDDSFLGELSPKATRLLERHAWLLGNGPIDRRDEDIVRERLADRTGAPLVIVLEGTVKGIHARWDGPSALVTVAGPGDALNAEDFLTGTTTITHVAWSRTVILLAVPHVRFHEILECDKEIHHALTMTLARRVNALTIQRGHAGRPVEQRLWAFLVGLGRRHGAPTYDGATALRIGLTRADLATAISASNKSVEAGLQKLRAAGKLTTGYRQVVLHELPTEEELDKSFWVPDAQHRPSDVNDPAQ
jgi:CRP/FNR family transcriptional regulator, cyclic AMP receptor protein